MIHEPRPGLFETWSDLVRCVGHLTATGFMIAAAIYVLEHLVAPAIAIILSGAFQ
jgi:hypothetical protein